MRTPVAALALVIALFSVGCKLNTNYFSDYQGKNILSNSGFSTGRWATTTLGLVASAPKTDYYMTWEPVGSGTDGAYDTAAGNPTAGPDGTAAYRVEIKNLIPDGDFETEANGTGSLYYSTNSPVFWSWTAGPNNPVAPQVTIVASSHSTNDLPGQPNTLTTTTINNQSLLFADQNGGDTLWLNLQSALGTLWTANQYRFRMDFVNSGVTASFHISMTAASANPYIENTALGPSDADASGAWDQINLASVTTSPPVTSVSKSFTLTAPESSLPRWIVFGKYGYPDAALVDDVRVVLAAQELSAQLTYASLASGGLPLLPGTQSGAYSFTVQVRDDLTANQAAGAGHAPNRFYPSGMTVTVLGCAKNTGMTVLARQFFPRPSGGWQSWTALSLSGGLDFVDSDSQLAGNPALEVQLSPTNEIDNTTGGKDTGSLLVASPTLLYNP